MEIPFTPNDHTNLHCTQAAFHMILTKLMPEKRYSMDDVIHLSGVVDGKATWPSRMLIELDKLGLEVCMIEGFDGQRFIDEGEKYLKDEFGKETATWQIKNSDIEKERREYKELLDSDVRVINKIPDIDDIRSYMDRGYLIKVLVNSKKLDSLDGYVGHSVLILDLDDDVVTLHNPGLPPVPCQEVNLQTFVDAWSSPNDRAREMVAVKRRNN